VRLKAGNGNDKSVWLSASQISTFRRCKRCWAFTYIDGEIAPESPATAFGLELHTAIEKYLKTGRWTGAADVVECAKQGEHLLPSPCDPALGIERKMLLPILGGRATLIGYIDLVIPARNGNPPEVTDHKSTKDLRYATTPDKLKDDVQANIYAHYAMKSLGAARVLARWRYYCARPSRAKGATADGRPRNARGFRAVTRIKTLEEVEQQWVSLMATAEEMVDLALNPNIWAKNVDGNPDACGDYGGCPFRSKCSMPTNTLGSLMEHGRVAHLKAPTSTPNQETTDMSSLMDIINRNKAENAALPQQAAPAMQATPPPKASTPPPMHVPSALEAAAARALAEREQKPMPEPEVGKFQELPDPVAVEHQPYAPPTLRELQQRDGAVGVNPPPIEEEPLDESIQEAIKPITPQTWIDRFRKGHKARSEDEIKWRAEQEKLPESQRAIIAAGSAPDPTPDPVQDAIEAKADAAAEATAPEPMPYEPEAPAEPHPQPLTNVPVLSPSELAEGPTHIKGTVEHIMNAHNPVGPTEPVAEDHPKQPTLRLYVDCFPVKGVRSTIQLSEVLRPMKDAVQRMKQVPHWNMVKYREGEILLAACTQQSFAEEKPDYDVVVDSLSGEWKACGDVLMEMADCVIRGGR
jgi:hypothetical protein